MEGKQEEDRAAVVGKRAGQGTGLDKHQAYSKETHDHRDTSVVGTGTGASTPP